MPNLRCAVAGLGLGRAWAKLIDDSPEFTLAGLIDVDADRLASYGEEFGVPVESRFTDYEQALARLEADAVVVVTPPAFHRDNVLAALEAGFHVLSEKPLAANIAEAREMAAAIHKSDRKFMVSQNYRWQDHVETVRGAIADGLIGEPGYVTLGFHKGFRFGGWREGLADVLLEDMSIHHFDLLRHLTGRNCLSLYARSFRPHWSWFAGNSAASVLIEMEGGIEVNYTGSWVSRGKETSWHAEHRIVGDRGAIHWDGPEATLVVGHPEDDPKEPKLESSVLPPRKLDHAGFEYSLYEFGRAVAEGREPVTGIDDNIQSFAMAMAAIESARTGQPIDVQAYLRGG
jgi:predicted dehydrogenase